MKIGVIGLGLMGGSFARALVKKELATVYAYDINNSALSKGEVMNAYNEVLTCENASLLDVLIISVYPDAFEEVAEKFLPYLKDGAIICDFCGIKRKIVNKMQEYSKKYPNLVFIGGHPMAGREFSGIERSMVNLFDKASMILVPVNADIFILQKFKQLFLDVGFGEVVITDSENHDKMIAYTSQLCHVVSNAFIKNQTAKEHFGYSAGSYKDLTRVARLNAKMWTSLMMSNCDKLETELDELILNLQKYQVALKNKDSSSLEKLLQEGNDLKIAIDSKGGKNSGN